MNTPYFVDKKSIVRTIWGKADTILFIFAGAAAEFALNKAVDWLYFTGKLPADPLGRLFSTVGYARKIIFAPLDEAHKTIDNIRHIHENVEASRGASIPEWAYRDVLFMLIHYSIASCELFEHKLSNAEKEDIFDVFYRVGDRMGLKDLPAGYKEWALAREAHMDADLKQSNYTTDLFRQYRKHLGPIRYRILIEGQKLIVPERVKQLLNFNNFSLLTPILPLYKITKRIKMDRILKKLLLPPAYVDQVNSLDMNTA